MRARKFDIVKSKEMLKAAEEWRKDFGVEDLIKCAHRSPTSNHVLTWLSRNFDFKEKAEVDKYYPQYYHKMDKVGTVPTARVSHRR